MQFLGGLLGGDMEFFGVCVSSSKVPYGIAPIVQLRFGIGALGMAWLGV